MVFLLKVVGLQSNNIPTFYKGIKGHKTQGADAVRCIRYSEPIPSELYWAAEYYSKQRHTLEPDKRTQLECHKVV